MKISFLNLALSMLLLFALSAPAFSQSRSSKKSPFGVGTILERFDLNKNGKLDPSEMKGRTKDIVKKAGLNPNQSHAIQTIAQKLENLGTSKKAAADKKSTGEKSESKRKVPGFGVEVEKLGVPDFSPTGEERMTIAAMNRKFGDSIMKQVERSITRYDTDKNGLLDRNEQKRSRWTSPSAEESDTNSDGNLSRLELAYRYKKREEDALKQHSRKSNSSSPSSRSSSSRTSSRSSTFSRIRANPSSPSRGRSASKSSAASTKKPFNSGSDAYKRYAEGLMKNYDKNKDKKLSKTEMKEMRRPPANADKNGDGYVDRNELIASVDKRSNARSQPAKESNAKNHSMNRLKRNSNSSYSKPDSIFGGKDSNNDGQLQMHEFESNWTKEKIAKFKEKDLNKDGVITAAEWKS